MTARARCLAVLAVAAVAGCGREPAAEGPPAPPPEAALAPPRRLDEAPVPEVVVPWEKAGEHVGRVVAAEGTIVRAHNSGRACFLNFAEDWQGKFHVVIFPPLFRSFPEAPERWFQGKRVRVTGKVQEYRGAPQIVVDNPAQIRILDG